MNGKTRLTPKQEKFCLRYLECGNASQAYRCVFSCARMKDETVNVKASELLGNGKITVRVDELQKSMQRHSEITKERILNELSAILESKITDYVDLKDGVLTFKNFDELTEAQVRAIESIKRGKNGIELRLHGKSWSIERICKMLGFDVPQKIEADVTVNNAYEGVEAIDIAKAVLDDGDR